MNYFHSAVSGDREDLALLWKDAEVDDGSWVAFQNTSWFPKNKTETKRRRKLFKFMLIVLKNEQNSGSSPRKMGVPQSYEFVHASSDKQAVCLTNVKHLDAFVDGENYLVTWCPELWSPAQLDLLGFTFVASLCDLSQLLLSVC